STAPAASPSHHSHHSEPYAAQDCTPPRQRLVTPTVALIVVLPAAARSPRPSTSRNRSREIRNPTTRCSSHAPITASRVFPIEIPHAVASGSWAVKLARNLLSAMPGKNR